MDGAGLGLGQCKGAAVSFALVNELTAYEFACIQLRIPESECAGLDALITKAQRRDTAERILAGILANPKPGMTSAHIQQGTVIDASTAAVLASEYADALLKESNRKELP